MDENLTRAIEHQLKVATDAIAAKYENDSLIAVNELVHLVSMQYNDYIQKVNTIIELRRIVQEIESNAGFN